MSTVGFDGTGHALSGFSFLALRPRRNMVNGLLRYSLQLMLLAWQRAVTSPQQPCVTPAATYAQGSVVHAQTRETEFLLAEVTVDVSQAPLSM